jgi:CRISPR-associated protein Cas1
MNVIVDAHGAFLGVKDGRMEIRLKSGEVKTVSFRQVKSVFVSRYCSLSVELIALCNDFDINLVFTEQGGRPFARIWNGKFGSIASVRRKQLAFSEHEQGTNWIKKRVLTRMREQASFLQKCAFLPFADTEIVLQTAQKIEQIGTTTDLMQSVVPENFKSTLRGMEGSASALYFRGISAALPEEWRFSERSRRPAKDPYNAVLNYVLGILYAMTETALLKAGIDPFIGILHADEYKKPVFSYDFIELYRHWAEEASFQILIAYKVSPRESFRCENGGLFLAGKAKKTVAEHFYRFLEETVTYNGKQRKRKNLMLLEAHAFAKQLLSFKEKRT